MKKWIFLPLILLFLLVIGIYAFIPSTFKIAHATAISASINGINRNLHDSNKWKIWWPGQEKQRDSARFDYNGVKYRITRFVYNGAELAISKGADTFNTVINLVPASKESTGFYWNSADIESSLNPLKRIQQYLLAGQVKNNMAEIIVHLKTFLQDPTNIYGVNIHEIISKDSTLITTNFTSDYYPTSDIIYGAIKKLRDYAASQGAKENNNPMLSVRQTASGKMQTMVAIPINTRLQGNGEIIPKRFVPWKTLIGEVRGGPHQIQRAYEEMKIYTQDYLRTSMAIPFESLITDRTLERDTSKWVTLICQPVS